MLNIEIGLLEIFAQKVYQLSSDIILNNFNNVSAKEKNEINGDLVTFVDLEVEKQIQSLINEYFPDHKFWGEETGGEIDSGYVWILDPLDGTNNYGIGLPLAGTALTLLFQNKPVFAFISFPFVNKWYFAINGAGAYLNGKFLDRIEFLKPTKKISGLVGYEVTKNREKYLSWLNTRNQVQINCKRVFETWAPIIDFYLLFENKIDTIIAYENEFFDLLGGALIARELGFTNLTFRGEEYKFSEKLEPLVSMVITSDTSLPNWVGEATKSLLCQSIQIAN